MGIYSGNIYRNIANSKFFLVIPVTDSGEGACVDPGEKGAILGAGGPGPPGGGKGWQLASDSRAEET